MEEISKALIVLGMHRSGTSLFANWIYKCGLYMGEEFDDKVLGNPKGQFEDRQFYLLHENILKKNDLSYLVTENDKVSIDNEDVENIQSLINKRFSEHNQWGWKEPRTCLFLDAYQQLLPSAKVVILYRSFNDVVDSLIRRYYKQQLRLKRRNKLAAIYNTKIKYKYFKKYHGDFWLKVWLNYNKEILRFLHTKNMSDYLVVNSDSFPENDKRIFNYLKENFKLEINYIDINEVFEPDFFQKSPPGYKFNQVLLNEALEVEKQFKDLFY